VPESLMEVMPTVARFLETQLIDRGLGYDRVSYTHSFDGVQQLVNFDVQALRATKSLALRWLAAARGWNPGEIGYSGDDANDASVIALPPGVSRERGRTQDGLAGGTFALFAVPGNGVSSLKRTVAGDDPRVKVEVDRAIIAPSTHQHLNGIAWALHRAATQQAQQRAGLSRLCPTEASSTHSTSPPHKGGGCLAG